MPHASSAAVAALAVVSLSLLAVAADENAQAPATSPAEADVDFAWQGEYAGFVSSPRVQNRRIGLQVVALGDGEFQAAVYSGGLPGAGWDGNRKLPLAGRRTGALLSLSGEMMSARIQPDQAEVLDSAGNVLGTLAKVRRVSSSMGRQPTRGATILFDGRSPILFESPTLTDDGLLSADTTTSFPVGDFYLHLEFRCPYMPQARGQGRGNSGVYIQRRYEVQILDSFGLEGEPNECGGLYRQKRPDVNMAFPPLSWQTYDIFFTAARFDVGGEKSAPARISVYHNGVAVHRDYAITSKTGAGRPEGPEPLPIHLQGHGSPVHYRNIWLVPMNGPPASACR